jgi:hypothetical protein
VHLNSPGKTKNTVPGMTHQQTHSNILTIQFALIYFCLKELQVKLTQQKNAPTIPHPSPIKIQTKISPK